MCRRGRAGACAPRGWSATSSEPGCWEAADVFVAAPGWDPLLAWEARACGASWYSVDDGPGLRYAADQPPLAAAAVARLLERPSCARSWRRGTRAGAQRGAAALAERLESLYSGLLRRRRTRPQAAPARPVLIDADLHMHTSHSHDCATDPEALVDHCIAQGLGAIAITDHNEISGALEAAALDKPITVIVGEEVKTSQGEVIGLFLHERSSGAEHGRHHRRDPATGRPGADAPPLRPPAHDPGLRHAAPPPR
jgi:hypothetical protein